MLDCSHHVLLTSGFDVLDISFGHLCAVAVEGWRRCVGTVVSRLW